MQIFLLLFADDIALIASNGLQKQINKLESYCDEWKMTVNTEKTKVIVFKDGG